MAWVQGRSVSGISSMGHRNQIKNRFNVQYLPNALQSRMQKHPYFKKIYTTLGCYWLFQILGNHGGFSHPAMALRFPIFAPYPPAWPIASLGRARAVLGGSSSVSWEVPVLGAFRMSTLNTHTHTPFHTSTHTHAPTHAHSHAPHSRAHSWVFSRFNSHPAAQSAHSSTRTRRKSQGSWAKFSLTPGNVLSGLGPSQVRLGRAERPSLLSHRYDSHVPCFPSLALSGPLQSEPPILIPQFLPALRTCLFHSPRNRHPLSRVLSPVSSVWPGRPHHILLPLLPASLPTARLHPCYLPSCFFVECN